MQRTAVITGGSRGIGLSIAEKLLREGFRVFTISRNRGGLDELEKKYGASLEVLMCDLSDRQETLDCAAMVGSKAGKIDILVNNAGIFLPGQIQNEEDGVFEKVMAVNINAAYHLTRSLLPGMISAGDGYIFNICSTASIMAYVDGGSYCISKHALLGMTRVLRQELMEHHISVSAVIPGATLTDSWKGSDEPASRFMETANISAAIWFAWENRKTCVMEEIILRPILGDL